MVIDKINRWIILISGLVVFGESLALTIGLSVGSSESRAWFTIQNITLVVADILLGIFLIVIFSKISIRWIQISNFITLSILILTHIYRNIDFAINSSTAFCFNNPLLVLNNIKLILLIGSLILSSVLMKKYDSLQVTS